MNSYWHKYTNNERHKRLPGNTQTRVILTCMYNTYYDTLRPPTTDVDRFNRVMEA